MQLSQGDLFDRTLEAKIIMMQRWIARLEKTLNFYAQVYQMRADQKNQINALPIPKEEQMNFFNSSNTQESQSP
jgi:hypothetical protein